MVSAVCRKIMQVGRERGLTTGDVEWGVRGGCRVHDTSAPPLMRYVSHWKRDEKCRHTHKRKQVPLHVFLEHTRGNTSHDKAQRDHGQENTWLPTSLWLLTTNPSPNCVLLFKSVYMYILKETLQPRPRGHQGDSRSCNDHLLSGDGLRVRSVLQAPQPLLHRRVSWASLWNVSLIKWLFHFLRSETCGSLWMWGRETGTVKCPYSVPLQVSPGNTPRGTQHYTQKWRLVTCQPVVPPAKDLQRPRGRPEPGGPDGAQVQGAGRSPGGGDSFYSNTSAHLTLKSSLLAATLSLARSSTFSSSAKSHKVKSKHH